MPEEFGQFIWYELMTTDVAAAAAFYKAVAGWSAKTVNMPSMDYTVLEVAGEPVGIGGILELQAIHLAEGIPPNWTGYILIDDVDLCLADLVMLGGSVRRQPEDIPGVGRLAVVADPFGAVFIVFTPVPMENPLPCVTPGKPGTMVWNELLGGDPDVVFPFYEKLFGWKKAEAIDMGEKGTYQLVSINGEVCCGMMRKPDECPMAFWSFYVAVDSLDAALARITDAGGAIVFGPREVFGDRWIAQATDPQGAYFNVVAEKR